MEEYTRFKITILYLMQNSSHDGAWKTSVLVLEENYVKYFLKSFLTTNLNNCVKNRDSTWVTESVHLLKHYIYLLGKFDFVALLYLSKPFNSC